MKSVYYITCLLTYILLLWDFYPFYRRTHVCENIQKTNNFLLQLNYTCQGFEPWSAEYVLFVLSFYVILRWWPNGSKRKTNASRLRINHTFSDKHVQLTFSLRCRCLFIIKLWKKIISFLDIFTHVSLPIKGIEISKKMWKSKIINRLHKSVVNL